MKHDCDEEATSNKSSTVKTRRKDIDAEDAAWSVFLKNTSGHDGDRI